MPASVETSAHTAKNPDRPDQGGGVFTVLGADLTALLAALLLVLIAVSVFPSQQTAANLAAYLPLHAMVQILAIVASILVFAVGWVAYSRERVGNSVLLSCAFLAVGLMDFAYTMAYPGMPDFVTPSSEGKAIDFWLAARGLVACALLFAAVRPWRPFASPRTRYWLLAAALGITALVYWLVLHLEGALPATFIPGQGPTPFKTGAEYTLIAVDVLAAAVFFSRLRIERADYLRRLFTACCVIMLSELFFTFYGDVADINNLPGHLYNAIAYLLIYQALSVRGAQEPYQRLQRSRQPRRVNMERRRTGLVSDWRRVGLSPDWYREQDGEAAQAMLAAIVENSNTAIIGCALDGTILSWNAAAERMFGWPASEAIGQPVAIIVPQQHHGLLQPLFEQAARGESVGQIESRHLRRDGTCIDTAGALVVIRDVNGETVFFTLTLLDITQQKQLEHEVRQKTALTELLEALTRAANEAETSELTLQDCLERICDYGQWMLGRIGTFAPGQPKGVPQSFWKCPQPARFDEFMRISNSLDHSLPSGRFTDIALREKKAVWASDFLAASESGRLASAAKIGIRCGFVFPVVVRGEALAFVEFFADEVRDPDSAFLEAINSVAGQLARVIERKQAEQDLVESQKQFQQLAEHIPQAFWITDMQRKELIYLSFAHEQIYGRRFSSLQSVWPAWKQAVHSEDRERVLAAYREMGSRGLDERFRILQPEGAMRWVHARGFPVRDASGTVYRVVGTIEDITERKQAEEKLRESEDRYRDLVEHSQDLICTHDLDGHILSANPWAAKILGYEQAELVNMNLRDVLAPGVRHEFNGYLAAIRTDGTAQGLMLVQSRTGEKRVWEYHNTLRTEGVSTPIVRGMAHDITERKQAERKLQHEMELVQLLEQLARAANEAVSPEAAMEICLRHICEEGKWALGRVTTFLPGLSPRKPARSQWFCTEPTRFGTFMRYSDGFEFNIDIVKLVGLVLREQHPVWLPDLTALDTAKLPRLAMAVEAGIKTAFAFPVIVKGEVAAVLEFFATETRPHDALLIDGTSSLASQFARMIERGRANETQASLAAIVEHSNDAIIGRAIDGTITSWNAAAERIFGYTAAEVIGRDPVEIFPPQVRQQIAERRKLSRVGQPGPSYESVCITKDGRRIDVTLSVSSIRDDSGNIIGTATILHDITERKRVEQILRNYTARLQSVSRKLLEVQEDERRRLARELHDQVGQTLTALKINLQIIERQPAAAPVALKIEECAQIADAALQQVRTLMLDLRPPQLDELGLAAALRAHAEQRLEPAGLRLYFSVPAAPLKTPPAIEIVCFRITQEALTNVLRHAGARNVWIELAVAGDGLTLTVRDDGRGFDLPEAHRRAVGGGSIGLLSMEERAALADGRIEISTAPGAGTTVRAMFSLQAAQATVDTA